MIETSRIETLNRRPVRAGGRFVLYWMQQSQRAHGNHALEYAVRSANRLERPVVVVFGLTERYPEASERHYAFMLEGLAETARTLEGRGVGLVVRRREPPEAALDLAREAALLVCDRGYLKHQRAWRAKVAREAPCRVVQVESDVVVPADVVSTRAEIAARTLRPRIARVRGAFLRPLRASRPRWSPLGLGLAGDLDVGDPGRVLCALDIDRGVTRTSAFSGGTSAARARLARFLRHHLEGYVESRGDPARPAVSYLSPYLHFGQISPVEIALRVMNARRGSAADREAFLEELIVRRELAVNFVLRTPAYDRYAGIPAWARRTLAAHRDDPRPARYTRAQLERAETADRCWNAAMRVMRSHGYLHNRLRMYWGKRIIEWSSSPEAAHRTALALNNRYFIDGRDASAYANVGWLFGLHDRPWPERPVFGQVRSMTARGLERKVDVEAWLGRVAAGLF